MISILNKVIDKSIFTQDQDYFETLPHNLTVGEIITLLSVIKSFKGIYINIRAKLRIMRFDETNLLRLDEIANLLNLSIFKVEKMHSSIREKLQYLSANLLF